MPKFRVLAPAATVAMVLALTLSSTASAFEVISQTGNYGEWGSSPGTTDSSAEPGAKCGYGAENSNGVAHLAWIKVFPFKALAYSRTTAVEQQRVKFKINLQRSINGGSTWKDSGSASQTKTAFDNKSAKFGTLKVNVSGKAGSVYRAIVTLEWLKNGQVDGLVRARIQFYSVKWTVGDPAFIYENACDGAAD